MHSSPGAGPCQPHDVMQVAKLLHSKGFFVTFVHNQFNYNRLLESCGLDFLNSLDGFHFQTMPDCLPGSKGEREQDAATLFSSTQKNCSAAVRDLILKLNPSSDGPPVTCIISDGIMTFTLKVAQELAIPDVLFWPTAACAFLPFVYYRELIRRGLTPFKGMRNIRVKDLPSFIRTTDPNAFMLNFIADEAQNAFKASAIIFNTFDDLEDDVLCAVRSIFRRIYTIGPLPIQCCQIPENPLTSIRSNLWKEDSECLKWLDGHSPASVLYVNFGSSTTISADQFTEFSWGLANSNHPFLWIVRPHLVMGNGATLPKGFIEEIEGRGMVASWCPQDRVLSHPSVGGFLTHCGWNSTLESISAGVPMICWPFFGDQQTDCRYACNVWGVGVEMDNKVERHEIEVVVKELMEGKKGQEIRMKAIEWKNSAEIATQEGGSSHTNLQLLINELLKPRDKEDIMMHTCC